VDSEPRGESRAHGNRENTLPDALMSNAVPAVSVVMTAYNRAGLIAASIESVLAQTFTDFELVVVDDRSTDDTVAVVQRYAGDPRVRLVVNDTNLGDYPNRNHAATLARGEFLKYHDSDDLMYPHCLEVMVAGLRSAPGASFALTSSRGWFGAPCPMLLTPRLAYQREYLGSGLFHVGPACALFRRDAFFTLGRFPVGSIHADLLFWLHACARVNIVLVAGDLFWYRVHDDQVIHESWAKYEAARLEAPRWRAIDAPESPLTAVEREIAKRNQAYGIARRVLADALGRQWKLAWVRFVNCGLSTGDWIHYLRTPRRRATAGSPATEAAASTG
jgi:hypothetical protein